MDLCLEAFKSVKNKAQQTICLIFGWKSKDVKLDLKKEIKKMLPGSDMKTIKIKNLTDNKIRVTIENTQTNSNPKAEKRNVYRLVICGY